MPETPFGVLLQSLIKAKPGLTQNGFAKLTSTDAPFLSQIVNGHRTPPLDRIAAWAEALELVGFQRERFVQLANLEHANEFVRELVHQLNAQLELQQQRIDGLNSAIDQVLAEKAGAEKENVALRTEVRALEQAIADQKELAKLRDEVKDHAARLAELEKNYKAGH